MKTVSIKAFAVSVMLVICGFMTMSCSESLVNDDDCVSTEVADISDCLDQQSVEPDYSQLFSRLDQFNDSLFAAAGVTRSGEQFPEWVMVDCAAALIAFDSSWHIFNIVRRVSVVLRAATVASIGSALSYDIYADNAPTFDDFLQVAADTTALPQTSNPSLLIPNRYRGTATTIAVGHNELLTKLDAYMDSPIYRNENVPFTADEVAMFYDYFNCESSDNIYALCPDIDPVEKGVIDRFFVACSIDCTDFHSINSIIGSYSAIMEAESSLTVDQKMGIYIAMGVCPYSYSYWTNRNAFAYGN